MNRCEAFRKALNARGDHAALVHRPENVRWLTGYTGEGCVFLAEDTQVILTDFRYLEQVERQAPECTAVRTSSEEPLKLCLQRLFMAHPLTSICVETDFLTYDEYCALSDSLTGVSLLPLNGLVQKLRQVKDAEEILCIQKAAAIACRAFENLLGKVRSGMTERQVQILLDFEMLELGSERPAFDTIAAAGVNGSLPHAVPSDHVIREGELLTLDFGATVNGYCSDMTRTIGFGKIRAPLRGLYQSVLEAQMLALEAIKPGAVCGDVDRLARDYLDARYPGAFGHSLGHGVGLFIHEQPRLGSGSAEILVPGNVVTIEPGVYIPGLGGCRIEDMAILTSDGSINPITAPKQLIEL